VNAKEQFSASMQVLLMRSVQKSGQKS
jgi:hypothetical protein